MPPTDPAQQDPQSPQAQLQRFLQEEAESLLPTLRWYLQRSGLAQGRAVTLAAAELLSEVALQALQHAGRYQPERSPRAWLLGIAANLIRRQRAAQIRLEQREPLVEDLSVQNGISTDELFDRLAPRQGRSPEQILQQDQTLREMLGKLPEKDQHILQLAVLAEMNGQELAEKLGITPGAARVRLHRALQRLRQSWQAAPENEVENHA